jgi:DNA-binding NarL/FixJ family response regulator
MLRILIIEDEILIGRFIEDLLQEHFEAQTEVVISAKEATEMMDTFLPHLLLCDINLGEKDSDGIDLVRNLQQKFSFETIYITSYHSGPIVDRAATTQPDNYLIKPINEDQFIATLKMTLAKLLKNPQLGMALFKITEILSKAEIDVLQLVASGLSTQAIADALFLSPLTIKNHRHNITRKLNLATSNNSLTKWVLENRDLF